MSKLSPPTAPPVGFVSLGCPKNLVDSEVMMGLLDRAGARLTARPEEAEILVVNTCSFIDTAKQESVDTILEMARHKTDGPAKKLIVAGCLVERYRDEIRKNIPEVDAVVGTGELEAILEAAGVAPAPSAAPSPFNILTHRIGMPTVHADKSRSRERTGIARRDRIRAEGDHPRAAGPLLPRRVGRRGAPAADVSLRREHAAPPHHAARLGLHQDRRGLRPSLQLLRHSESARQVPLAPLRVRRRRSAATRRARRPRDHAHRPGHNLLRRRPRPERRPRHAARRAGRHRRPALAALPLRLSQPHHRPAARDHREARQHLQVSRRPLQHASPDVLKRMKRGAGAEIFLKTLEKVRAAVPGIALRTSFIVGFPGESSADFEILEEFIDEAKFDWLGVFTYSDEEGSGAFSLDAKVPKRTIECAQAPADEAAAIDLASAQSSNGSAARS